MINLVAVTVTVTAAAIAIYTDARCGCNRILMSVPGQPHIEIRALASAQGIGLGRVVRCKRCKTYVEVIENG